MDSAAGTGSSGPLLQAYSRERADSKTAKPDLAMKVQYSDYGLLNSQLGDSSLNCHFHRFTELE
jgi:hypothetical protein